MSDRQLVTFLFGYLTNLGTKYPDISVTCGNKEVKPSALITLVKECYKTEQKEYWTKHLEDCKNRKERADQEYNWALSKVEAL